ncbi:extended synaptotagmin-2-like isoform X2 [Macrobrachium rosenbergii]|uniref:extended synaptotagmin-2-like isoform X2 n=1 Tax=Macrobrachium rosenbergii TaxID=79674 RepID=UPI0034D49FA8
MENSLRKNPIIFLQRILNDVNETLSGANALVPWFDLPLFLRELTRALCLFILVRSSFVSSALVVLYLVISARDDDDLFSGSATGSSNSKTVITLSTVFEFTVAFLLQFSLVMLFYIVPFPSLVFLTFVRTWLDSFLVDRKVLDERLLLEKVDEERLGVMLQRLGMQVPAWLSTPDHQRVEWLNKILVRLWPHIGTYLEDEIDLFIDSLKPKVDLEIKDLSPGEIAPRVSSVKVRDGEEQLFIDVSITYGGDFSGCFRWFTGVEFEVDHIQVQADIQLELKDFVGHQPFVGTLVVHMDKPPIINPRFKKMASSIEAFKPIKKALLDYVQNSVKGNFPFTVQLAPDVAGNLIENLNNPQSETNKASTSKAKNNTLWDIVSSRPLLDETKPSQIMSFLQERNSSRRRSPDPEDDKKTLGLNDSSSFRSEEHQKKSCARNDTDEDNWTTSHSFTQVPSASTSQGVPSLKTSSSQSQNLTVDWYISSPSNQSPLSSNTASQVSVSSAGNESSDWLSSGSAVTVGRSTVSFNDPSSDPLDQVSEAFQKSQDPIDDDLMYGDRLSTEQDGEFFRHSYTSPGSLESHSTSTNESTDVRSSPGMQEEDLRAAIARDVETSRGAFLDKILTESEIDDEYLKKKEVLYPALSVSNESLTRIKDTDQGHGCIELTTRYPAPNTLVVTVHKVRNLPKKVCRIPNPYVKLYLQNQQLKPVTDVTTEILDNTQNPVFEKTFAFQLEHPLSQYTLRVSAKTKHKMAHKLGEVVLCFARYSSSQVIKERNWYDLADPKKDYVLCWVGYRDPVDDNRKEVDRVDYGNRVSLHSDDFNEQLL